MDPKIFICYRRVDSSAAAAAINTTLKSKFPRGQVFLDIGSILPGSHFLTLIEDAIREADIVLVIIGPKWLTTTNIEGRRYIDEPTDYVRIEIELALKYQKQIVPILIENTPFVKSNELPNSLVQLVRLQALVIRPAPNFNEDILRLEGIIQVLTIRVSQSDRKNLLKRFQAALNAFQNPSISSIPNLPNPVSVSSAHGKSQPLHRIFISHSHLDNIWCRDFIRNIPANTFHIWFDETDMRVASQSFIRKLEKEILSCSIFVVILSHNSISSEWVNREFDLAMQEGKIIVPVLQEQCDLHGFIKTYHQVNAIGLTPYAASLKATKAIKEAVGEIDLPEFYEI